MINQWIARIEINVDLYVQVPSSDRCSSIFSPPGGALAQTLSFTRAYISPTPPPLQKKGKKKKENLKKKKS